MKPFTPKPGVLPWVHLMLRPVTAVAPQITQPRDIVALLNLYGTDTGLQKAVTGGVQHPHGRNAGAPLWPQGDWVLYLNRRNEVVAVRPVQEARETAHTAIMNNAAAVLGLTVGRAAGDAEVRHGIGHYRTLSAITASLAVNAIDWVIYNAGNRTHRSLREEGYVTPPPAGSGALVCG